MNIIDPNLKFAYAPGFRSVTTHLILHHAAALTASVEDVHRWHLQNGWAGIAYHYYIRKNGDIYLGRPEAWTGGHTTNWNWCSIGICFEGNFEIEQMPDAQRNSGAELVKDIMKRFPGIAVGKHSAYQATACPGRHFPFDAIVSKTTREPQDTDAEPKGPSDWAKASCEWAVENGIFIGDGSGNFRWHDYVTREELAALLERISKMFSGS